MFTLSKGCYSSLVLRIHHQVKAPQALDGQNVARLQQANSLCYGILDCHCCPLVVEKLHHGPTNRAGIGLSVKPAVHGIIIFSLALGTHLKVSHGGFGPVIGDIIDDGVTGTAVGAVNKRVLITPVPRVQQFLQAVIANGHVR